MSDRLPKYITDNPNLLDGPYSNPISPVCTFCKNLIDEGVNRTCRAFPDVIPVQIWTGRNRHTEAFPGDNGIRFDPIEGYVPEE